MTNFDTPPKWPDNVANAPERLQLSIALCKEIRCSKTRSAAKKIPIAFIANMLLENESCSAKKFDRSSNFRELEIMTQLGEVTLVYLWSDIQIALLNRKSIVPAKI